jgi:hypothetical protein
MPDDKNHGPVTRREFYVTAGTVYICIGLLALSVAAPADGLLRSVAPWILAATGILCGLLYVIAAARRKSA